MPIYDIAGLKVKMDRCGGRIERQGVAYLAKDQSESQHIDIEILVDDQRIQNAVNEHPELNSDDWEYMISTRRLSGTRAFFCTPPALWLTAWLMPFLRIPAWANPPTHSFG